MVLRFLTSGESHGKCLNAIIDGIPSGFTLDFDFINNELKRRQQGYGRGERQKIESDKVEFNSGVRFKKTLGTPICIEIKNKDYKNWASIMDVEGSSKGISKIVLPRPGHADLSGLIKYNYDDIRNVIERASARETAARVAVGAICQNILSEFKIKGENKVLSVGEKNKDFKKNVDIAKKNGDTLGGVFEIKFKNVPVGLGSYVQYDRRLDMILTSYLMSIPAIKAVEIGEGIDSAYKFGSEVHDEIFYKSGKYIRKTNNCGGIEGGISNGSDIVLRCYMKPIPSLKKPLNSVSIKTKKEMKSRFERSDTEAVFACSVVALNMASIAILDKFLEKFSGDSLDEIKRNFKK